MWRCIFCGRQIAPAWATLRASAARASATASPTATPAAITAPVAAAVSPSVTAAAKILDGAVVSAAGRIALRGIVMRREVLGRGSIGIRLAFFCRFGVVVLDGGGRKFAVMFLQMFTFGGVRFLVGRGLLLHVVRFVRMELFVVRFLVMFGGTGQGFTGKHLNRRTVRRGQRWRRSLRLLDRMPVIVIFEVFENVADV